MWEKADGATAVSESVRDDPDAEGILELAVSPQWKRREC